MTDTAFHRKLFVEMTGTESDAWLDGVRTRRLASVEKYKQTIANKQRIKDEKMLATLSKESDMMEKEIATLEKALNKVELRANKIAAIMLMAESMANAE